MARINFDDSLFKDRRFTDLAIVLGSQDHAIGALVFAWMVAQKFWLHSDNGIPKTEWKKQRLKQEIIDVGLAEDRGDFVYISGSKEQFAWLRQRVEAGRQGGKQSGQFRAEIAEENSKRNEAKRSGAKRAEPSLLFSPSSSLSSQNSDLFSQNSNTEEKDVSSERQKTSLRAIAEYAEIENAILERKISERVQLAWRDAYPDPAWVCGSVRKALAWEAAHPNRRKKDFGRFMTNWLNRDWDRRQTQVPTNRAEARSRANYEAGEAVKQIYRNREEDVDEN